MNRKSKYSQYGFFDGNDELIANPTVWNCVSSHPFKILFTLAGTYIAGAFIGTERSFKIAKSAGRKGIQGTKLLGRKSVEGAEAVLDRIEKTGSKKVMTAQELQRHLR